MKGKFKYIYGPVSSWRLGSSLGVDPLSGEDKICSFDCIYCQIGKTCRFEGKRKTYVSTAEIMEEIALLPAVSIDYITFSGRGEPTLAENLGEMIKEMKKIRSEKIAVLTNSSLMDREDVRRDLLLADFVIAKLDACDEETLTGINRPLEGINFGQIVKGIKQFKKEYPGKLALQMMFMEENKAMAEKLAGLAKEIEPDEVQINTPLRPCLVAPLSPAEIKNITAGFKGMNVVSVYQVDRKKVVPITEKGTLRRRGKIQTNERSRR